MPPRILVVDDEPDLRNLLRVILERSGYDVTLAEDGQQALRHMTTERPHLVLCDVVMPRLDGYQTLAAIRSNPRTRDVPVLMLSAKGQPQDVRRALEAGADGYIIKPFRRPQLLSEVQRCLEIQRLAVVEWVTS